MELIIPYMISSRETLLSCGVGDSTQDPGKTKAQPAARESVWPNHSGFW